MRQVRWIEDETGLLREVAGVGDGPLAVDTEADSFHHYREKVCLIQLSFGDRDLLVDPLAGVDLGCMRPIFEDPAVTKILHGADYDIRMLHRDFGMEIHGLYDTMIAARICGERAFGLSALLKKHFDVTLEKRYQRANWSRRPLTRGMEQYAVMDTRYLYPLSERLSERLERLGRRGWADEEFERLESVRWGGERRPEEAYLRLKGIHGLDRAALALLREIAALRERTAKQADLPAFRIARDDDLLQLVHDLRDARGAFPSADALPRRWASEPGRGELEQAIARARELKEEAWPVRPERRIRRRDPELERRLKRIAKARDRVAQELQLEPSVVASRAVLEQVLACADRGEDPGGAEGLRRWQQAVLADVFREL